MGISIRDKGSPARLLRSQSGQGIIEYILVLVVTVGLILGALYQLNTAFKAWASNYFGDYIACLLETGELPSVGGTPGDSGICNQLFTPFDIANGRRLIAAGNGSTATNPANPAASAAAARAAAGQGAREKNARGGGGGGSVNAFNPSFGKGGAGQGGYAGGAGQGNGDDSTGNTNTSNYGYGATNRRLDTRTKQRLDNGFAFEREQDDPQTRKPARVNSTKKGDEASVGTIRVRKNDRKKDENSTDDQPMTFGNFMRWLIIAAIIIALVVLLGGQMLQVGKSME